MRLQDRRPGALGAGGGRDDDHGPAVAANHWPKAVDVARDGTVYVTNGSDQGESCLANPPVIGAVFKVATGQREQRRDQRLPQPDRDALRGGPQRLPRRGAREGRIGRTGRSRESSPVRQGDNWGFPCCATTNMPYQDMEFQDNGGACRHPTARA